MTPSKRDRVVSAGENLWAAISKPHQEAFLFGQQKISFNEAKLPFGKQLISFERAKISFGETIMSFERVKMPFRELIISLANGLKLPESYHATRILN